MICVSPTHSTYSSGTKDHRVSKFVDFTSRRGRSLPGPKGVPDLNWLSTRVYERYIKNLLTHLLTYGLNRLGPIVGIKVVDDF